MEPAPRRSQAGRSKTPVEHVEHPVPLIGAQVAEPHQIPAGAKKVIKKAELHGWRVVPTYALGTTLGGTRSTPKLVHSLAARLFHADGKSRAVAVWVVPADPDDVYAVPTAGWKADGGWVWQAGTEIPAQAGVTALSDYLVREQ